MTRATAHIHGICLEGRGYSFLAIPRIEFSETVQTYAEMVGLDPAHVATSLGSSDSGETSTRMTPDYIYLADHAAMDYCAIANMIGADWDSDKDGNIPVQQAGIEVWSAIPMQAESALEGFNDQVFTLSDGREVKVITVERSVAPIAESEDLSGYVVSDGEQLSFIPGCLAGDCGQLSPRHEMARDMDRYRGPGFEM